MKLVSLKIKNFRGYKATTEIQFDDLTVFVGKNDVGKSTILDALDIFFNDGKGAVKIEKSDVNVQEQVNENTESVITACFSELPETIVIDALAVTSLQGEYMLNADGQLEIVKKYKNGGVAKTYIYARHPSNPNCSNLLLKKNNDLKRIVQEMDINCENLAVNATLRQAIWNYYSEDLQLTDTEIDITKEDAKVIWEKLSRYLPIYSLFQSDRKNSDSDDEVQDPLKIAVNEILTEENLQGVLAEVAHEVKRKLEEVSDRTLEKLQEIDPLVADSLNPAIPEVTSLKWQDVFKNVSISGDGNIPINKRGSGVKRLVLLSFFRAEAERRLNENGTGVIYAIEEPETSQHSENQELLIKAFKTLAVAVNTQVVLSTHSSHIVKQLDFDHIRLIKNGNDEQKEILPVLPGQLKYPSLNEVNYVAFDEVTEEYHNELFGFIDFYGLKGEFRLGKPTRLYRRRLDDGTIREEQKILTEYIRHQIHHPENRLNERFTKDELKESIDLMREFINDVRGRDGIVEP